ncbi:hypothetical protein CsSME_00007115 [Camellia sinensis var. sinensis]
MAQLQAISSSSSPNFIFYGPKQDPFLHPDKVCCSKKLPSFQELGARASELYGHTIVHSNGNLTKACSNKAIQAILSSEKETVTSSAGGGGVLRKKLNKVVLAYSGGLDTSVIVPWLRENYGCEVVCFTADVGQGVSELKGLEEKAKASGACQLVVKDLREEFVKDYIYPCLRAGAIYERKYLLGTSMARPVIAKGDILEDPANEPQKDMYMMSVDPEDAPNQPEYVEIGIVSGLPISVNGKELSPASLLSELNEIGGRHGIGRIDMVENRLVGMKSRGVYETPGGTILFAAALELESLTLDRETIQVKDTLALKYAELVYAGRWFDPLRESMDAFMEKITATTTGSVTLKLYKGSVTVTGRKSPYSLYRQDISSFESGQIYDQADAAGFIRLYGLPMRVRAMLEN